MHMGGNPRNMQNPENLAYKDIVAEIKDYLQQRYDSLVSLGIQSERICLDPGIGFAKTHQHNLTLLQNIGEFFDLPTPLLVGHSRKGFLAKIMGCKDRDRTLATAGVSLALAAQGVQVIRVHDVQATRDAIQSFAAAGGIPWIR